jgi:hypothetical protein
MQSKKQSSFSCSKTAMLASNLKLTTPPTAMPKEFHLLFIFGVTLPRKNMLL